MACKNLLTIAAIIMFLTACTRRLLKWIQPSHQRLQPKQ